jgi:predicted dehydrogenase
VKPRLGFAGVGWIGRNRMQAIAATNEAEIAAIADPRLEAARAAAAEVGGARVFATFEELLAQELDGIVIATPNALHARQSIAALNRGRSVFCQKPLGRFERETREVVDAARAADRLLGADLSYRHTAAVQALREEIAAGAVGELYAADLVFHNAYGPDKAWFRDVRQSGGGCLLDLGTHLVDLALWFFDAPVAAVDGRLFAGGKPFTGGVEDYATVQIDFDGGPSARVACSWNLPAGSDADIRATFYGTRGAVTMQNEHGSFYDFTAARCEGTRRIPLVAPPDDWGGRAAVAWMRQLAADGRYDPSIERLRDVAAVLDAVYARHEVPLPKEAAG